jgi:hypothetical protein
MGKNMWQEMGENNGAPGVGEGKGFGSQKRLSQFCSNPNQTTINKHIKIQSFPVKLT